MSTKQIKTDLVVLGSGPAGYTAAFRAADLGLNTTLVERYDSLGGVCLNVGCIPSKALLHAAKVIDDAAAMQEHGIQFGKPKIDFKKLLTWKETVVGKLTGGLKALAKQRKVNVVTGVGEFSSPNSLLVKHDKEETVIEFKQCIIAAGSRPVKLSFIPEDKRIFSSTGALQLPNPNGKILVIGGGIIGCEMATVYRALGAKLTIVEFMDQLMPGADKDIANTYHKYVKNHYEGILLKTKVTAVDAKKDGVYVTFEGDNAPKKPEKYDQILQSVGRIPNGKDIAADKAGVKVDDRGFIPSDNQLRTNVPHIFSIGDIRGVPMLAHKGSAEGHVAAEVAAGKKHYFEPRCIPAVAYTDPEIAWVGVTETEAKQQGIKYDKGVFPWAASGRSLGMGRSEGLTKLLFDEHNHIIGGGIIGPNAGEIIAEVGLAIEMGCDAEDISLTIHAHPTVSETIKFAAEVYEGVITDLYMPKKRK